MLGVITLDEIQDVVGIVKFSESSIIIRAPASRSMISQGHFNKATNFWHIIQESAWRQIAAGTFRSLSESCVVVSSAPSISCTPNQGSPSPPFLDAKTSPRANYFESGSGGEFCSPDWSLPNKIQFSYGDSHYLLRSQRQNSGSNLNERVPFCARNDNNNKWKVNFAAMSTMNRTK